jgi:N-acetyl-gamma-glutamyl-phosphate reductase
VSFAVGIVGVSGYGGGEILRLCAGHPAFELRYVGGESSAGQRLEERFPGLTRYGDLVVERWDPRTVPELDLLFVSLPTGESASAVGRLPERLKIVDVGGDHRFANGWTYGLTELWPDRIGESSRVADPGCYPAASLLALAPLVAEGLVEPHGIVVDAKSGVSGAGRGGGGGFGFSEVNEDVSAYGLIKHSHLPEMRSALSRLAGESVSLTFTPHLIPMTRGILATCYARAARSCTTEQALLAAQTFYEDKPFVRVVDRPPHTKWALGSNLAFLSYAADPAAGIVIALGAIDNLGKGAAGQAVQNANVMCGLPETTGLESASLWP